MCYIISVKKRKRWEPKLDKDGLHLLLNLRMVGWSYGALGAFFNMKVPSVKYQCEKYGIIPYGDSLTIPIFDQRSHKLYPWIKIEENQWYMEEGTKRNRGKSYKEYLRLTSDKGGK